MNTPVLDVSHLKTYFRTPRGTVKAVDGVSFEVRSGEILGIVGESGCGKSMVALSVMRLVPPPGRIVCGKVLFQGTDLLNLDTAAMRRVRGKEISMVFQEPTMSLNPVLSCGTQVSEAMMLHLHLDRRAAWGKAIDMLDVVGLPSPEALARQYPHQLSGGMQQRVMIAMAIACHPSLLIADEPTTALDVTIQAQIIALLKALKSRLGMACMFITHDLAVVAEIAERIIVFYAGRVIEQARTEDLFAKPLHPYTRALLQSIPTLDDTGNRLRTVRGVVPDALSLPGGCAFHPRCPECMPVCRDREPEERTYEHDRSVRCWLSGRGQES